MTPPANFSAMLVLSERSSVDPVAFLQILLRVSCFDEICWRRSGRLSFQFADQTAVRRRIVGMARANGATRHHLFNQPSPHSSFGGTLPATFCRQSRRPNAINRVQAAASLPRKRSREWGAGGRPEVPSDCRSPRQACRIAQLAATESRSLHGQTTAHRKRD